MVGVSLNQVSVKISYICERLCSQSSDEGNMKQFSTVRDTIGQSSLGNQENTLSSFKPKTNANILGSLQKIQGNQRIGTGGYRAMSSSKFTIMIAQ